MAGVSLALVLTLPASAGAAGETISGVVTDSDGDPVEGLCVHAWRFAGSGSTGLVPVRTDSAGAYTITAGMTAGDYRIEFKQCDNPPYGPPEAQRLIGEWWNDKPDISEADTIVVGEGEAVTGIDAELEIGAELSGRVLGPDGQPIRACVGLWGPQTAHGIQTAPTGQFKYNRRPAGDFVLRVDDCEYEAGGLAAEWWDNKPTREAADVIALAPGDVRNLGDITLSEGGSIEGTVTDESGAPLQNICVKFFDASGEQYGPTVATGADGSYSMDGFLAGEYRVGYSNCYRYEMNVAPEFFDDAANLDQATPVLVTEGGTEVANAVLAPGGSISGVLRGPDQRQLANACVYIYEAGGEYVDEGRTREDGSYSIGSLETGSYEVGFDTCGATEQDFEEFWDDKPSREQADPVAVTLGADTADIDATLGAPDPVAPETTITAGPANGSAIFVSSTQLGFTSNIPGSSFECRLDGGVFAPCQSPRTLGGLGDGPHSFEVRATSPAGLIDGTPAKRNFIVKAAACNAARQSLVVARAALVKAKKKAAKARKKLKRAKRGDSAAKLKKAKRRSKAAQKGRRVAQSRVAKARAGVAQRCAP